MDHPRSRGVYHDPCCEAYSTGGSSPLARGLPLSILYPHLFSRIIPARAGFTGARRRRRRRARDHPRSRGVYAARCTSVMPWWGSSPLARGLHHGGSATVVERRIIPARAGFTAGGSAPATSPTDHPRSRGVYLPRRAPARGRRGSSPLARGLPGARPRRTGVGRIIPARAGFTGTWAPTTGAPPDHPRSRGVYRGRAPVHPVGAGIIPARAGFTVSSAVTDAPPPDHPRSRGVYPVTSSSTAVRTGSSPLARGLPRTRAPATRACPDHPRSRGVYQGLTGPSGQRVGSSPLARGLRMVADRGPDRPGIIPARAGFTPPRWPCGGPATDHPRSRGVYTSHLAAAVGPSGSSPLARGLRSAPVPGRGQKGIIPARAGFTLRRPRR